MGTVSFTAIYGRVREFRDVSFAVSGGSLLGFDIDEEEMARMEEVHVLNIPADPTKKAPRK